jgi:hypothetical protein
MKAKLLILLAICVCLVVVIVVSRSESRRTVQATPVQNSKAIPAMALLSNRNSDVLITNDSLSKLRPMASNSSTTVTGATASYEVADRLITKDAFLRWDTNRLDRFSLNARFGLNISAKFKRASRLSLTAPSRTTPDGNQYNYDDGYVLTDISGNAGGQTWNWGYDQPGQIAGNTISMHRSTVAAGASSAVGVDEDAPQCGFEFTYDRELGKRDKLHYGLEAAVNYMNLSLKDNSAFSGDVSRLTDAYPFPGTTPPTAPYQGSFNGPGFVLGSTPVSSTTALIPGGATIVDQRNFDADIWGFRLGPYAEYPLSRNIDLWFSGGLAMALVDGSASWKETASIAGGGTLAGSGGGSDLGLLWGGYLSAKVSWQLSERWSAEGGVQYQYLGTYEHNYGGQVMQLDLSQSVFLTIGLGYRF